MYVEVLGTEEMLVWDGDVAKIIFVAMFSSLYLNTAIVMHLNNVGIWYDFLWLTNIG